MALSGSTKLSLVYYKRKSAYSSGVLLTQERPLVERPFIEKPIAMFCKRITRHLPFVLTYQVRLSSFQSWDMGVNLTTLAASMENIFSMYPEQKIDIFDCSPFNSFWQRCKGIFFYKKG